MTTASNCLGATRNLLTVKVGTGSCFSDEQIIAPAHGFDSCQKGAGDDHISSGSITEPDSEEPPRNLPLEYVPGEALRSFSSLGSSPRRATASWPTVAHGFRDVPATTSAGSATASWESTELRNQDKSRSQTPSYGSAGAYAYSIAGSFDSTVTDFDYLTSPGAQAEMNPSYLEAVRGSVRGDMFDTRLLQGEAQACLPIPALGMMHAGRHGSVSFAPPAALPPGSVAGFEAQAADFEFMAAQLMARAYQAKAMALRAQTDTVPAIPSAATQAYPQNVMYGNPWGVPSPVPQMMPASTARSAQVVPTEKKSIVTRTTVMLRNLPNDYTRDMVLELLDEQGFKGCYDFIYLPMDLKRKAGLGYAFVNMVAPLDAERVFDLLDGFTEWKRFSSSKRLEVAWGDPLQGLEPHVNRYRNSPVMHEDVADQLRPMLFKNGVRIPFPPPTRKLRVPRVDFREKSGGQ